MIMKISCGLLVSGNLGFLALKHLYPLCFVKFVFTDNNSDIIKNYCLTNNIHLFIGNPRKKSEEVISFLMNKPVDYIISVNYLFIVDEIILNHPKKFGINFHGSLLPKYRGRTPHVWAIINGEKETGITAHIMDKECDNGDIISQIKIDINEDFTGADILNIFSFKYIEMLDSLLINIEKNQISMMKQDLEKATYFGKRTPEDGRIDWNWQKERIKNWVRAQAYPYPGAFSFYNGQKVIIDKIEYSDFGYNYNMPNGLIVKVENEYPFVKTPNGVIFLSKIRNMDFKFIEHQKFE
ncbi:MAG: methionyl-tRNA formyltransferase [Ignavibacteriales bacterium]|nr:methionyl-tRNA formyltransferase [Ignavibacteriales bacterium]